MTAGHEIYHVPRSEQPTMITGEMPMSDRPQGGGRNVSRSFLEDRARFVRKETVRLSRIAGAGHYSSTFSAAELFAALYYAHLRFNPAEPRWPDRDRFILSKGHAALGLYPVLADLGFFDPALLDDYTRFGRTEARRVGKKGGSTGKY